MMYRLRPATRTDLSPAEKGRSVTARELREIKEASRSLERWEGEGGSPHDRFGVVDELSRRQEAIASAVELSRRARATWPGWLSGPDGRLTPPPRVRQDYVPFQDKTGPGVKEFGYYLIRVPAWDYSQILRASHSTASRVARSRTQYGDAELHFLGVIETPALD
jgi:hypothetical protein